MELEAADLQSHNELLEGVVQPVENISATEFLVTGLELEEAQ